MFLVRFLRKRKTMKPIARYVVIFFTSLVSILTGHASSKATDIKDLTKTTKKLRPTQSQDAGESVITAGAPDPPKPQTNNFPWRRDIVTTTFWIGEKPTPNNPVPNHKSSWDPNWASNYGGFDTPNRNERSVSYTPVAFVPQQNPFYIALPYNDMTRTGHKPEAANIIPWFKDAYQGPDASVCKGRWIAIRKGTRVCYAQWEDVGPFRTDHWQYVFGEERPRPNLNKGAGLDVSPAVRDYLGMDDTDLTDWKFVDFSEVPVGPWSRFGDNNTFVINRRKAEKQMASLKNNAIVE